MIIWQFYNEQIASANYDYLYYNVDAVSLQEQLTISFGKIIKTTTEYIYIGGMGEWSLT